MSDYKNRDDVITEIKRFKGYLDDDMITRLTIAIDKISSADVVEVVRCKDCKHHEKFCFDDSKLLCWVHDTDIVVSPTDFCSYGKRSDEMDS